MSYLPNASNSKRSTSCSNSNFTPSKNISKSSTAATNNNNHFHTRYSTSPGSFLIHQTTPGHLPYSPSACRSKGLSYLNNSVNPSPSLKYNMTGRFRTREPVIQRDFPIKSTYRPENINDWSYLPPGQESHFGSLAKPSRNVEVGDLSLSGLSLTGPSSIKKSTSHQDMSNQLPSPKYHQGIAARNEHARPLPELHSICRRSNPQSTFHTSRRSSFTKGRIFEESRVPQVRDSVADTVARLNRLNEAEKVNPSFRLKSVENSDERNSKDDSREVKMRDGGDENNGEVSSVTNSPNNNTNNFSRKYMNKGCTGLQNLGNTCFMNCVLQCLANTRPLLELCLNSDLLKEINNETSRLRGSLATAYVDLMQSMWRGLDVITPGQFKIEVSRFARLFAGYNQQDAQEFLMYLLQGLHEDLNRVREKKKKKMPVKNSIPDDDRISATEKAIWSWKRHLELENSYIVDLFEGLLKSALKCRLCGYVSNTFDPFLGLSLPIKKVPGHGDTTLMDCLELFTHEELLDENEKTTCDKCKRKQNSTKRLSIQKFPNILVINLKRFSEETFYRSKLSTFVRCPVRNLDLRKFSDENVGDRAVYNLYGVCNHSGTPHGGHYTAMAKNPYSNEWHYFNDQNVSTISENVNPVSSEAYILFYELSSK